MGKTDGECKKEGQQRTLFSVLVDSYMQSGCWKLQDPYDNTDDGKFKEDDEESSAGSSDAWDGDETDVNRCSLNHCCERLLDTGASTAAPSIT